MEEGGAVPKTAFFINTLVGILNTCTSLVWKFFETPTGGADVSHPALHFMEKVLFFPKGLTKNGSWLEAARKVNPENAMLSSFSTARFYATKRGVRSKRLVTVRGVHKVHKLRITCIVNLWTGWIASLKCANYQRISHTFAT